GGDRISGAPGMVRRVIARLHVEMRDNLETDARFRERVRSLEGGAAGPAGDAAPQTPGAGRRARASARGHGRREA
ncbi:MAG: hypothetical protein ACXWMX_05150, partial [Candidatus Limnocylindrales bacterium]